MTIDEVMELGRLAFPKVDLSTKNMDGAIDDGMCGFFYHPSIHPHTDMIEDAYYAVKRLYPNKCLDTEIGLVYIGKALDYKVLGNAETAFFTDENNGKDTGLCGIALGEELFKSGNELCLRSTLYHELCHAFYNIFVNGRVETDRENTSGEYIELSQHDCNIIKFGVEAPKEETSNINAKEYSFAEYLKWFSPYAFQKQEQVIIDCMNLNFFDDKRTNVQASFVSHDILTSYCDALKSLYTSKRDGDRRLFKDRDIERKALNIMLTYAHPKDFLYIRQALLKCSKLKI
jgi:hypothetical protein